MRAYSMDLRERAVLDSDAGIKQRRRETGEMAPRVQQDLLEGRGPACRVRSPGGGSSTSVCANSVLNVTVASMPGVGL